MKSYWGIEHGEEISKIRQMKNLAQVSERAGGIDTVNAARKAAAGADPSSVLNARGQRWYRKADKAMKRSGKRWAPPRDDTVFRNWNAGTRRVLNSRSSSNW